MEHLNIILTGVTGVLGGRILKQGLENSNLVFWILIRSNKKNSITERWNNIVDFYKLSERAIKRVHIIEADLLKDPWEAVEKKMEEVGEKKIDGIIHSAGDVNMAKPLEQALEESRGIFNSVFRIAELSPDRPKIDFVSTVGVAGHVKGDVPESWIENKRSFRNTYEHSKAEAELFLRKKAEEGWKITVHRPSMIVGHSETGENTSFQVFYHLCDFLSGKFTFGFLPDTRGFVLDTVPVDYVAKVVLWSHLTEQAQGLIMHESSSRASISINELRKLAYTKFQQAKIPLRSQKILPLPLFKLFIKFIKLFVNQKTKRRLDTLGYFFAYMKDQQCFSNTKTLDILKTSDIHLPEPTSYLAKQIEYFISKKTDA